MSGERSPAALRALGDVARRVLHGEVSSGEHERGRAEVLAAFAARRGWRGRRAAAAAWLAAAALACLLVAGALVAWPRAPLGFTVDGASATAGRYVHAPPGAAGAVVRFGDGSEVTFAPGASGRIAEVGPRGARVLLESGAASVHVVHTSRARWSVEAGPFAVAVTGTRFDVAWSSETETLEVRLDEGAVTVRGPLAPNGIDLRAGQHLAASLADGEIRIGEPAVPTSPTLPLPPPRAPDPPPPEDPPARAAPVPTAGTTPAARAARGAARALGWSERVATGDFRGVLADADARGVDAAEKQLGLADLVALADAARYAGRPEVARSALQAERDRFAGSAEARSAAFLLGRLADDAGGPPAAALRWYDRYLAEAPRGAFAAEALGRKMTALRRAGDPAASAVAAEYLRLYPAGPHAEAARELAAP